jgi:hypothetical protein
LNYKGDHASSRLVTVIGNAKASPRVGDEVAPCLACGVDNGVVVFEDGV